MTKIVKPEIGDTCFAACGGKRFLDIGSSALGSRIVLGCCALHPLLYLFLEDPVSDFIIKRREIGVELPATRKYFCSKMREPNLIFGSFKILLETQSNGVAALRQPRFFDLRVLLSRGPETHV